MRLSRRTVLTCVLVAILPVCPTSAQVTQRLAIQAGHLFDATDGKMRGPSTILVTGDRIDSVVTGFAAPAGYTVIDQQKRTILPGLIDCHDHLTFSDNSFKIGEATPQRSDKELALLVPGNARRTLEAGFTTIRNVGAWGGTDLLIKRAIERGDLPGPRMFVALEPLGPTGGHSDLADGVLDIVETADRSNYIVDGVDAVVRAVRDHHRRGADLIKIMPGGGIGSVGDDPDRVLMTDAEMKAAVETAHSLGMKVAAHAEGRRPIAAALAAGVDSIEHGDFSDAQSFALMRREKRYLVPTLSTSEALLIAFREHPQRFPAVMRVKIAAVATRSMEMMRLAVLAGVPVAFGTDATGFVPHGGNAMEFALMHRAGMSASDAILTATRNAADLIGSSEIGIIAPGKYADMIAVDGDPIADLDLLTHVSWVMKGGEVVKHD